MIKPAIRLCFLHIPKTAGTTVNDILFKHFPTEQIFPGQTILDYRKQKDFSAYSLYKGHLPFSFAQAHFPEDTRYITLLREPVERALSLYYFWRDHSQQFFDDPTIDDEIKAGPLLAQKLDIFDFFKSNEPKLLQATRNNQLFRLKTLELSTHSILNREQITQNVQENLKKFSIVGVQSLLPFFIYELKNLIGFQNNIDIPYENRSKRRHELEAMTATDRTKLVQIISDHNAAETEVYNRVETQVKERLNQYFTLQLTGRHFK